MKKKFIAFLTLGLFVFVMAGTAQALTVTDLYGDVDGFNGLVTGPDQYFSWTELARSSVGEGFTDYWLYDSRSWTHTFDISSIATITSASLELFTGGIATGSVPVNVLLDGQYVGSIEESESDNYSRIYTYDLMSISSYLNGVESITISADSYDGWVLDYSKITISGDPVPEPATMLLLGSGLVGLAGVRRKKFKK